VKRKNRSRKSRKHRSHVNGPRGSNLFLERLVAKLARRERYLMKQKKRRQQQNEKAN